MTPKLAMAIYPPAVLAAVGSGAVAAVSFQSFFIHRTIYYGVSWSIALVLSFKYFPLEVYDNLETTSRVRQSSQPWIRQIAGSLYQYPLANLILFSGALVDAATTIDGVNALQGAVYRYGIAVPRRIAYGWSQVIGVATMLQFFTIDHENPFNQLGWMGMGLFEVDRTSPEPLYKKIVLNILLMSSSFAIGLLGYSSVRSVLLTYFGIAVSSGASWIVGIWAGVVYALTDFIRTGVEFKKNYYSELVILRQMNLKKVGVFSIVNAVITFAIAADSAREFSASITCMNKKKCQQPMWETYFFIVSFALVRVIVTLINDSIKYASFEVNPAVTEKLYESHLTARSILLYMAQCLLFLVVKLAVVLYVPTLNKMGILFTFIPTAFFNYHFTRIKLKFLQKARDHRYSDSERSLLHLTAFGLILGAGFSVESLMGLFLFTHVSLIPGVPLSALLGALSGGMVSVLVSRLFFESDLVINAIRWVEKDCSFFQFSGNSDAEMEEAIPLCERLNEYPGRYNGFSLI